MPFNLHKYDFSLRGRIFLLYFSFNRKNAESEIIAYEKRYH